MPHLHLAVQVGGSGSMRNGGQAGDEFGSGLGGPSLWRVTGDSWCPELSLTQSHPALTST